MATLLDTSQVLFYGAGLSTGVFSFRISETESAPVDWAVVIPGFIDPTTFAVPPFSAASTFNLRIVDANGITYQSPPLIAKEIIYSFSEETGEVMSISGTDLSSWKLSQANQSLPTFRNVTHQTLFQAISIASGVNISTPVYIPLSVAEENIKQSTWWAPLQRLAEVLGSVTLFDRSGNIRLVPSNYIGGSCTVSNARKVHWGVDLGKIITGFVIDKKTSQYQAPNPATGVVQNNLPYLFTSSGWKIQQLRLPVVAPRARDVSTIGSVSFVIFFDGNPGDPATGVCGIDNFNPNLPANVFSLATPNSIKPAQYMGVYINDPTSNFTLSVSVQAAVMVYGSTPPSVAGVALPNLDLGFTLTVGTVTGSAARPGPVRSEPLYPSKAYAIGISAALLYAVNEGSRPMGCSCPLNCEAEIAAALIIQSVQTLPTGKIVHFEHSGDVDSGINTEIIACQL